MGHDPICSHCDVHLSESETHCLWSYPIAFSIWHTMALLFSRDGQHVGFLSWLAVLWLLSWPGPHLFFEGGVIDAVLMLSASGYRRGLLSMIPPILNFYAI